MCVEFWTSKIILIPLVKCTLKQNSCCNIMCQWLRVCLAEWPITLERSLILNFFSILKRSWKLTAAGLCDLKIILFRPYTVSHSVSTGCPHLKLRGLLYTSIFSSWTTEDLATLDSCSAEAEYPCLLWKGPSLSSFPGPGKPASLYRHNCFGTSWLSM